MNLPENNSISKIFTFIIFYIPYTYLQYDYIFLLEPFYLWVEARRKEKGLHTHRYLFSREGWEVDRNNRWTYLFRGSVVLLRGASPVFSGKVSVQKSQIVL